jgi:hypothetical protein
MRIVWLLAVGFLSIVVGMFSFWGGEVQAVVALTNGIMAVAAIVFGVVGVWMSVLHPVDELNRQELTHPDQKTELALKIAFALEQATYVLGLATLFRLSLSVLPLLGERISTFVSAQFPDFWLDALVGIAGSITVFLYLFEFCVLMISVLPILTMRKARRDIGFYKKEAEDPSNSEMNHR